ncbi:mannose-1-phosphate guanylyltransferase [Occultella glacieicola]|uniref:Mannose-1-phosphate guanylyltransferase n=1 Tax=Occultella glacieicola TaxID=2518684 RepID=A0ABY2E7Z0_9MICO|nr:mannose-1-phosphate guanylyltransferase [Occultella glacieicola]TDE97686.1 mannose-1-phosphate guanylyltransferase [Occultella glacieicola]
METFYAVIPAGGAGTRLWPLSRAGHPKFLHDLTGTGRTLIQATADRLAPLVDGTLVVTGAGHADAIRAQLPGLPAADVLLEPGPRDSMAAIGLAAAVLLRRHPDEDVVLGSFAADHVIDGKESFDRAVRAAVAAAREDFVVTIGITADHPSTAFGYIEVGEPLDGAGAAGEADGARHVVAFAEKPDAATAARYLATGSYRWNAGMFVVRATVLLEHLRRLQPTLADGLTRIAADWDSDRRDETLARHWPALTRIAIDHAIAEPVAAAGGVAVVPGDFGWDDVGDWASLADLLPTGADGVLGSAAEVVVRDAPGSIVVPGAGRTVVLLGIDGAVVVDTPDALLVTTREHAQRVKDIVGLLKESGRGDLT